MRCPECNRFATYDDSSEPEVELEVSDEGSVSGSARIVLTHSDCGTELKETTFEIDEQDACDAYEAHIAELVTDAVKMLKIKPKETAEEIEAKIRSEHVLSVEVSSSSLTNRTETKDRNGRPIKSSRYMKTFYGFETSAERWLVLVEPSRTSSS